MRGLTAAFALCCTLVAACGTGSDGGASAGGTPVPTAAPAPAEPTTPSAPPVPAPTETAATGATPSGAATAPAAADPPQQAVAATLEGSLVLLDVSTGEQVRTLARYDSPRGLDEAPGEEVATGAFLDSVAVGPGGEHVYFSLCCEPAPGRLLRVLRTGGDPQELAGGYEPAVSPADGSVAVVELQRLTVLGPDGGVLSTFAPSTEPVAAVRAPAWSPDGRTLAFEVLDEPGAAPRLALLDRDAASMDDARPVPGQDQAQHPWTAPSFDRDGRLVVAQQPLDGGGAPAGPATQLVVDPDSGEVLEEHPLRAGVVEQVHDIGGTHLLALLDDGTAIWRGPGDAGAFGVDLVAIAW